ncbi:hypothetical protein EDB87DRAFT_1642727 [Lactarius vividus]|nr:hypothetical protein EDB87DRAFT_1642727 [Lactarius vividus]
MRLTAVRNSVILSHYCVQTRIKTMSSPAPVSSSSTPLERTAELHAALGDIRARIAAAISARNSPGHTPKLVAVSKYKPATDISACYDAGQRDFGENYVQELIDKAAALPRDVRWHFIGTVQSNKAKALAGVENLYAVQTLASTKVADALNRHRAATHAPLRVLVQINTSGEAAKGGVALGPDADEGMVQLGTHVVRACPRLRLVGLMTIGAAGAGDRDFAVLREARDQLMRALPADGVWGEDAEEGEGTAERRIGAGSDIVRVGTGIFGARPQKKGGPDAPAEQS